MTSAVDGASPKRRVPLIERLTGFIALLGGLLALCTALLVVVSVIGRKFFNSPINGDFEMVQMATAIAIFSFLPYSQARRGNIMVDTFTTWLPRGVTNIIDAFWDLVYAGMVGLMGVCLLTGTLEHLRSGQTTMLLQLIVWPALGLCAVLSLILACTAVATAAGLIRGRT